MGAINWDMVGVLLVALGMWGGVLFMAAKAIFVTKSKIYDVRGITIFMPRDEYKNIKSECEQRRAANQGKLDAELKAIAVAIVPRAEWEKSKDYRERLQEESQKTVCGKIDKITDSMENIQTAQNKTSVAIGKLAVKFDAYLDKQRNGNSNIVA